MDTNCPIKNALPFSTESGNQYIYDNYSGLTFPEEPSVLTKLTGDKRYLGIDRTSAPLPDKIDERTVKAYITEHSYNQLTMEMNADCNFRCRYCIYGEHYPETRTPSHQKMTFDTAKKAVDYYMAGVRAKFRKNLNAYPTIGFNQPSSCDL